MLKKKVNRKVTKTDFKTEKEEVLEKLEIVLTNPLKYFDYDNPNSIIDFQKKQNFVISDLLNTYSVYELMHFIDSNNSDSVLTDSDGNLYYNPSVTLTIAGNIIEVLEQSNKSVGNGIIKLSKDTYYNSNRPISGYILEVEEEGKEVDGYYYNKETGYYYQVENYNHYSEKSSNELRKTFRRLGNLINANTEDPDKCLWVTLTYAENVKGKEGNEKLYQDFRKGIQKLRRRYKDFEYISVVEPQGRGAWHCHVIFIFPNKAPYIPNKVISDCWGQGFTKTKKMDSNVDNLGSYLTAYLTDLPLEDVKKLDFNTGVDILENCPIVEKENKQIIKGGRLYLYPPYMKLYRTSRGIKQAEVIKDASREDIETVIQDLPSIYDVTYELQLDDVSNYKNIIKYTQYNKTVTNLLELQERKRKLNKNKQ